jgi:pimeloyl-ACP methyl ester carboxylesterase
MTAGDGFADFFYAAKDGLKLHARIYGGDHATRLPAICLPGLTRNVRDFHELALFLSSHPISPRKVIAFDYRGRGASSYDPDWKNYTLVTEAGDVLAGLAALDIARAAFIGTSRGGLIVHVLAALRPDVLGAAILNDIGPVVEAEGLAHIRSYLGNASSPASFAEAERLQRAIHGADFPALADRDWARMTAAIYRDENGLPVADFDPRLINTIKDLDLSQPVSAMWPQFEALGAIPLKVIRGENSRLLSAETVAEMGRRHGGLETLTVPGQGHPPMLETLDLPDRIAGFLAGADPTSTP